MKNIFLISFSAFIILGLTACGGKGAAHESTSNQGTGQPPPSTTVVAGPTQPAFTPSPTAAPVATKSGKNGKGGTTQVAGPTQAPAVCDGSGPIGKYSGYITLSDGSFVPLALLIDLNRGGSTTGTPLKASLQVGLFGGVTVATDSTIFTFNDGSFTATFTPAIPGGTTLQLQGNIQCGVFYSARLHGKVDYAVTLSKGAKSPFDSNRQSFKYEVTFPSVSKAVRGVMTVGRLTGTTPSGDFSDLPTIPRLSTTFQFDDHSPIVADTTLYDPLRGSLELSMGGNISFVKCETVRLSKWAGDLEAPSLQCEVTSGGASAQKMVATLNPDRKLPVSPEFYLGTWKPANKELAVFKIVADVTYMGTDGKNPPGYLFPTFPMLSAKIFVCNKGVFSQQLPMISQAIDQVTGKAIFRATATGNTSNILDFQGTYPFGWGSISGPLVSYESGEAGSATINFYKPISKGSCEN